MKYHKKPVVIEAIQATGTPESNREIIDWTRGSATPASMDEHPERGKTLSIATLEGAHWVSPGDWIIKGVKGEFYPCKPDIFAATYEPTGTEREPTEAQIEEYEILCNGEWVAGASGPGARAEILHYLTQYEQDGPCEVYAVTRRLVDRAALAAKEQPK